MLDALGHAILLYTPHIYDLDAKPHTQVKGGQTWGGGDDKGGGFNFGV